MKIGLLKIEPKIVNTAYMQISAYHKSRGDCVEWASPSRIESYDRLYCSSLFTFTDKSWIPKRAIIGGTGYNLITTLPKEIEDCNYDYSIYPDCDYSIVWFSRGCIRKCPYCVAWKKEGILRPCSPKPLNPRGKLLKIYDNNFFANKHWKKSISYIEKSKQQIHIESGIDVRIINNEMIEFLKKYHRVAPKQKSGQIKIAWDNPKENLIEKMKILSSKFKPYSIMCYVLIGYWSTPDQDLYRVETLRKLGIDPFVMPYNKEEKYQKSFARWTNQKAVFKTVAWRDYKYNPENSVRSDQKQGFLFSKT